jgi:hypothetical protein
MSLLFLLAGKNDNNFTTYNFGNVTFTSGGLAVCVIGGGSSANRQLNSASVGGNAAAINVRTTGSLEAIAIVSVVVAAGDRAITATFNGVMQHAFHATYLITDYDGDTPLDADSLIGSAASGDVVLDFPTDGMAVYGNVRLSTGPVTFSNAAKDSEGVIETRGYSTGSKVASGLGNIETISHANVAFASVGAVWSPVSSVATQTRRRRELMGGGL